MPESTTDVGQFVKQVLDWFEANPELNSVKAKGFAWVLDRCHSTSADHGADIRSKCTSKATFPQHLTDWEVMAEHVIAHLDSRLEAIMWEQAIMRFNPPTHAHGKTMLGAVKELLGQFGANYSAVLMLVRETPEKPSRDDSGSARTTYATPVELEAIKSKQAAAPEQMEYPPASQPKPAQQKGKR